MINSQQPSEIHIWPIERLVFYARNPRKNDAAVDRMVASIREYRVQNPGAGPQRRRGHRRPPAPESRP